MRGNPESRALAWAHVIAGATRDVGVSHERREHHCGDEEYGHAQQDHIDEVAHVVDDDSALGTQGCNRLG